MPITINWIGCDKYRFIEEFSHEFVCGIKEQQWKYENANSIEHTAFFAIAFERECEIEREILSIFDVQYAIWTTFSEKSKSSANKRKKIRY